MDQNTVILELLREALKPRPPDHLGDLIKIGLPLLGGFAAGWFTLLNTRFTLRRDAQKRYSERRRDLLRDVQKNIGDYDRTYRHQKAAFDALAETKNSPEEYNKWFVRFQTLDEELRTKAELFADISGILLLLGEADADTALEAYREATDEWFKKSEPTATEEQKAALRPLRKDILEKRKRLMEELARIYRRDA